MNAPYYNLLNSITVGSHTPYANRELSLEEANDLLELAIKKFGLIRGKNNTAEGKKYFAYVGSFPITHLALDNKWGTTRLHTITTKEQLEQLK